MITITDYDILEQLYESSRSIIYRGIYRPENRPVILKKLKSDFPSADEVATFKRENTVTQRFNLEGVIKSLGLKKYRATFIMILEDIGGQSLAETLAGNPLKLVDFLPLALRITRILGQVHQQDMMHKDITASNIIWNRETHRVNIIDFGIATTLSRETPEPHHPDMMEGTPAYMSPEQTGRMNRAVDYRTDFYSLGVTFYELLTGRLPFNQTNPLELVHAHLAKSPQPPRH